MRSEALPRLATTYRANATDTSTFILNYTYIKLLNYIFLLLQYYIAMQQLTFSLFSAKTSVPMGEGMNARI